MFRERRPGTGSGAHCTTEVESGEPERDTIGGPAGRTTRPERTAPSLWVFLGALLTLLLALTPIAAQQGSATVSTHRQSIGRCARHACS